MVRRREKERALDVAQSVGRRGAELARVTDPGVDGGGGDLAVPALGESRQPRGAASGVHDDVGRDRCVGDLDEPTAGGTRAQPGHVDAAAQVHPCQRLDTLSHRVLDEGTGGGDRMRSPEGRSVTTLAR